MKFYRLDLRHEYGTSIGYQYFTTKKEAWAAFKEHMTSSEKGDEEYVVSRDSTDVIEI